MVELEGAFFCKLIIHRFALTPHFPTCFACSEHIESVDEVKHDIGIDGVGFRIASAGGRNLTADVAAAMQEVEGL